MESIYLSAIVPVYRGEHYLRDLVQELERFRDHLRSRNAPIVLKEAIFVDDGSVDGSSQVLAALEKETAWLRVIELSRNFGQHPATMAGILHSSGDWVISLDEDLQHPPKFILQLLELAVLQGRDVVYGLGVESIHHSLVRDRGSRMYKRLLAWLSGNPFVDRFSSFRLMRGSVARAAAAVSTQETYFDVALGWFTQRIGTMELQLSDQRNRQQQKSGYSLMKLIGHARRLLVSSEVKLLRIGALIGVLSLLGSSLLVLLIVVLKLFVPSSIEVPGWAALMVTVFFFFGLISLLHGIALEYMSIMLKQTQGKPTFFVVDRSRDASLAAWFKANPSDATS